MLLQPLRLPGFGRLLGTYTLNELTDWLSTIALAVLVWDATKDPFATTALFVATKFLPALVVPPLSARLDAFPARAVFAVLYALQAIVLAALALSASTFSLALILALAIAGGTVAATARAVTRATNVAVLEPAGMLREGNAALNVGFSAMNAGGPAIAGLCVAAFGVGPVLAIAAAVAVGQCVLLGTAQGLHRGDTDATPWRTRLQDGLSYVRGDATLLTLLGGQTLVFVLLTMVTPIEVIYAKETLGAGNAGLGIFLASWGAGMVVGSWLFARERNRPMGTMIVASTVAMAVGYLGMAAAPVLAIACIGSAIGGIGNGVQWVAVVTALQEATEDRFQARVAGLLEAVLTAAPGLGFLLGGALTALLDPRAAFAAAGGGVLVVLAAGAIVLRGRGMLHALAAPASVEPDVEPEPAAA